MHCAQANSVSELKLESIPKTEDIGSLSLGDIIDIQAIQSLMDDFYC